MSNIALDFAERQTDKHSRTWKRGKSIMSAVRESGVTLKPSTAVIALSRLALIILTPSVPFSVSPLLAVALKAFDMDTSAAFLTPLFQFAVSGLRIDCSCFGPLNCCLDRGVPGSFRRGLHQIKWKSGGSKEENG